MRYLLIVENPGYTIAQREFLLKAARSQLPVLNVRVASSHIEVYVKTDDVESAKTIVEKLVGGRVIEVVDITFEEVPGGVERYVQLFNQERYWEAHNALEPLWRSTHNPTLQGLIMLAAAFVKLQEGQPEKFELLLKEALQLIEEDVGCLKASRVKEMALRFLLERRPFKLECL